MPAQNRRATEVQTSISVWTTPLGYMSLMLAMITMVLMLLWMLLSFPVMQAHKRHLDREESLSHKMGVQTSP